MFLAIRVGLETHWIQKTIGARIGVILSGDLYMEEGANQGFVTMGG